VTAAVARLRGIRWDAALASSLTAPVALTALTALSLFIRTRQIHAGFWIDEGISVGIAHHHWSGIPSFLRQDGSPPAYYMLLGLWIRVFGDTEAATHSLSLVFGLLSVPLAFFAGRALFGRTTGLVCAVLAALNPFLTYYAQETRMYELDAFCSLVVAWAYVECIVRGKRLWAPVLVAAIALMVYSHNWGLFVCLGLAAATAAFVRERLKLFAVVVVGVAVLYAPWLPTLLFQAQHTGAPWSTAPSLRDLLLAPGAVLSGDGPYMAFALVGGAALYSLVRNRSGEERQIVLVLAAISAVAILAAFVSSLVSPAWTVRYFSVVLGPMLLLAGHGLVRARRMGLVALVAVVFYWGSYTVRNDKENAEQIAAAVQPYLHRGELVVSTHPEQMPVLRYYLGAGLRWANTMGPVTDPHVFDWRDAVTRLRDAKAQPTLESVLATVPRGREFVVIAPVFRDYRAWRAKWTKLVWKKSSAWTWLLQRDPRVRLVAHILTDEIAVKKNYFKPLQAYVYRRVG